VYYREYYENREGTSEGAALERFLSHRSWTPEKRSARREREHAKPAAVRGDANANIVRTRHAKLLMMTDEARIGQVNAIVEYQATYRKKRKADRTAEEETFKAKNREKTA
jgi:uncharacterized protein YchJ